MSAPSIVRPDFDLLGWNPSVPATMPAGNSSYTAQWNPIVGKFNANPMVATGCFSRSFGGNGLDPQDNFFTLSADAKNYLISKYSTTGYWYGIPFGGNGIDHLVFTHVPGRKRKYTITMDIEIKDHP